MDLRTLKFCGSAKAVTYSYSEKYWPALEVLCPDKDAYQPVYSPSEHRIYHVEDWWASQYSELRIWSDKVRQISDGRPLTAEEIKQIKNRYSKAKQATTKAKARRAFDVAVIGKHKVTDDRAVRRYLAGNSENSKTSSGVHVTGGELKYYGGLLLRQIGPNEYLLGRDLTSLAKNSPSCSPRVMSVLLQSSGLTLWPTLIQGWSNVENAWTDFEAVFMYCERVLKICQLKMPTAKDKETYNDIYQSAKDIYHAASNRWSATHQPVEDIIAMYGDIPKMKEHNVALRMQYEMTGEVYQ